MMALSHNQARQWLERAADGLLNPAQQAQLDAHLATCAECRAYAEELSQLEGALRATLVGNMGQPAMQPQTVDRLVEGVQKRTANGPGSGGGAARIGPFRVLGLLALVALAAIGLFYGAGSLTAAEPTATSKATATEVIATPTNTNTPTQTATVTLTPTPSELIVLSIPQQDANCRLGNSSSIFDIADTLFEGEIYTPNARGTDNLWVRFRGPITNGQCWVFVDSLDLLVAGAHLYSAEEGFAEGTDPQEFVVSIEDIPEALLPFVGYPPTPTQPPTATPSPEPSGTPASLPQCSDGKDNDGDSFIDLADPDCSGREDDSESTFN